MARAEQMMALLDLLRSREETTVDALASDLGVSRRTLFRYVATLRERGTAIVADVGRGGGIRLERDGGATRLLFTDEEIVSLWLSAHLAQRASELPWSGASRTAMARLFASLPRSRARELRALCSRVVVAVPATPSVRESAVDPPRELLAIFERAFTTRCGISFTYEDRHGARTHRTIEPHGLLVQTPVWYILARDTATTSARTFRMDRITRPRLAPQVRFVPDRAVVDEMTQHLQREDSTFRRRGSTFASWARS